MLNPIRGQSQFHRSFWSYILSKTAGHPHNTYDTMDGCDLVVRNPKPCNCAQFVSLIMIKQKFVTQHPVPKITDSFNVGGNSPEVGPEVRVIFLSCSGGVTIFTCQLSKPKMCLRKAIVMGCLWSYGTLAGQPSQYR